MFIMKKLNQKGVANLVAILVVVIIGIVGFTGWKVYDSNKKTTQSLENADNSDGAIVDKNTQTKLETNSTQTKTDYLAIKEWAIKVPLAPDVQGLTYKITRYNAGTDTYQAIIDSAVFVSAKLKEAGCTEQSQGLHVYRGKEADNYYSELGTKMTFKAAYDEAPASNFKLKLGGYYYFEPAGGAACGGDKDKEASVKEIIRGALNKAEILQ